MSNEKMLSSILSIFGLGQKLGHTVSAKFAEACKLNAEFELNLNNAIDLLRTEQVHLRHRISTVCENAADEALLPSQTEPLIEQLISETEIGLATSRNTQATISNSSRFSSIRKWDECLSILHRHVAASKYQFDRAERTLGQFHRVLDNAGQNLPSHESFEIDIETVDTEQPI